TMTTTDSIKVKPLAFIFYFPTKNERKITMTRGRSPDSPSVDGEYTTGKVNAGLTQNGQKK
ncbi:hypothetical protein QTO17_03350, partial [Vibrio owensii]